MAQDRLPGFETFPSATAGRLRIVDVSRALPRAEGHSYPRRNPNQITRILVHQTQGAFAVEPEIALMREGEYFIAPPGAQGIGAGRGWPGFAYTYWVPWWPRVDGDRRIVVYRCQPDDVVSNHTHCATVDGVAVAFQGCFPPARGANCEPSDAQRIAFGELAAHLLARHHLASAALAPHSALGKADCPGSTLAAWITEFQRNGRLL